MKTLLLILLLVITGMVYSQDRQVIPKALSDISVRDNGGIDDYLAPYQTLNPITTSKSVLADIIGRTWYDSQTNGNLGQRIYVTEDAKMGAVWTRGMTFASGFPDRGTGYNYFDGTSWMAEPSARIETLRTGWPSIASWNGNGEVNVAHQSGTLLLLLEKRAVAGTGSWTESSVPAPAGASGLLWPSLMTSGDNHEFIHILVLTAPTANGGTLFNGLEGALLYYRSNDGGTTWQKNGIQIPTLVASNYYGFSSDCYSWAAPKGDTIAFLYCDSWADAFIMESFDNGETWNKIPILASSQNLQVPATYVPPFHASDGSGSLAIDNDGIYHVVFGRMRVADDGSAHVYYPFTDGLIYWNSTMPMLEDSLDLEVLDANGQLLGYVLANAAGDSIINIAKYGVSMTSFPGITVDENNDIFVSWAGVTVDVPSPEEINYRHIYARGSNDGGATWSDFTDMNSGINDTYFEFVFPSMAKKTTVNDVHYIYQTSDIPGSNIMTPTEVAQHESQIGYNSIPKGPLVGIENMPASKTSVELTNYPNPFRGKTTILVSLPKAASVVLDVTTISGQVITSDNKGVLQAGINQIAFDGSALAPGLYFYSVKVNGITYTKRMVVR